MIGNWDNDKNIYVKQCKACGYAYAEEFNGEKCHRYTAKNEIKEFEIVTITTEQLLEQHICEICKSRKDCNNNICSMCQIVAKGLVKKGWKFRGKVSKKEK